MEFLHKEGKEKINPRGLLLKHIGFLVLFILLTGGILGYGLYNTRRMWGDATAINYAGGERMRSFKLAYLTTIEKLLEEDQAVKAETLNLIEKEMERFERVLYGLRDGDKALGLRGIKPSPQEEGPWRRLSRHIERYQNTIKPHILEVFKALSTQEAKTILTSYKKEVLSYVEDIDKTVKLLEEDSNRKLLQAQQVQFSLLGAAIALAGVSIFLTITLIQRPLLEVVRGMGEIAAGNLKRRIKVKNKDEIGMLAQGFNTMAEGLERQKDLELEIENTRLQLFHAQKMATLGQLVRNLAHEIKTPIAGIVLHSGMLLEKIVEESKLVPGSKDLIESIKMIQEASSHCQERVSNLLRVSRAPRIEKVPTDVNKALEHALAAFHPSFTAQKVRLNKELSPRLPEVLGSHIQFETLFMNIMTNALEATPEKGTITVKSSYLPKEDKVEVFIIDTGSGISKENLPNLFKPFFTTKPEGKGTGLGLSISQDIIKHYQGKIVIDSELGKGTVVRITFPASRLEGGKSS